METSAAIGIVAAPAIISALIGILKPLVLRILPTDAIPIIALLLGMGYTMLAWAGGVIEADNAVVAGLLGITVGIGATGAREALRQYRPQS